MSHFATFPCIAAIASALLSLAAPSASAEVGDDLIPVFRRAAAGAPLRVAMVGVSYIRTTLESKGETTVHLGIGLDYFGKLWVNGELVATFEGGYGPYALLRRMVALRDGPNELMLKVHSGSQGNGCELCILDVQRDPPAQDR